MALLPLLMFLLFHGLCLGLLDLGAKLGDSYGSGGHSCAGVSNNSTKDDPKDIAIAKEQDSPKLSDMQLFTDLQSFFQASSAATSAPFNSKLSDSFSQSPVLPAENFREVPSGLKPSILSDLAKFWFAHLMSHQAFADKLNSNPLQAIPVDSLVATSPAGHQFEKPLIHTAKLLLPFLVPAQRTIPGSSLLGNLKYSTLRPQAGFHPVPSMPLESPSSFGHLVDPLSAPPVFHEVPLSQAVGGLPSALSMAPSGSSIEVDQASPKLLVVSSRHFSTLLETYPNIIPDTKTSNTAMPFSIGSPQPAPASPVIRGTVSPEGESSSWMSPSSVPIIDMPGLPFPPRGASPNMFHLTTPSALPSSSMHSAGPPPYSFLAHETFPLQGDGGSPAPLMGLELVPSLQSHPKAEVPVFLAEPPLSLPVPAPNVILNPLSFNSPHLQPAFPPVPSMMGPGNNLPFQDPTRPVSIQASPSLPSPPRKSPDRNQLNSPAPTEIPTMTDQIPLQTPQSVLIPPMPGLPSAPVVGKRLEAPYPTDSSQHTKHSTLGNPIPSTKVNDPQSHPHVMPPVLHDIVHVPSETPGYNFQAPSSHNLVPPLAPLQESHAPYADNSPLYIPHSPLSDWKRHHKHLIAPASVSAPFQGLGPGSSSHARFPVHSSPGHIQSPFRAPQIVEPKPVPPNPLLMPPLPNAGPAQVPAEPPQRESKPAIPKLPITSPSPPQDQGHLQTPLQVPPVIQPMPAAPRNPITFQSPKIGHKGFPVGAPKPAIPKSPKTLFLPPPNPGHARAPDGKPQIEPEPAIPRKPRIFPSPPPRPGCVRASCSAPYTQTLSGTPCGCVLPIQVELELGVALYALFPLISVLAEEVANGTLLLQSQVHITGADADSENQERSIVDISLVPLADAFDRVTALMIFRKFWKHLVYIDPPLFGDYTVIFVRYPGLPPSPPSKNPAEIVPGEPFQVTGSNAEQPLGVEIRRGHNKIGTGTIAVIAPSAAIAGVICLGIIWFMLAKCSNNSKLPLAAEPVHTTSMPKRSGGGSLLSSEMASSTSMSLASSMATYTGSAKMFTLYELEKATNVFNSQNVVGEGGFGRVYHGILDDGTMVAVKVLTRDDEQGGKEFMAEVEMLSRLHHRNLVKLIGICIEEHSRCLVYEFVPNGSLESHLHGMDRKLGPMDWYTRMKIALGAARGLAYLHEDSNPRVIHRDFKASNILLEDDFTPKVSDFGLAKAAPDEGNGHISTRVMGTFGYVAPEYAMTGHLLVKSDVYSYGVVLLELLSGRKPVDMSQPPGQENLVTWARPLLSSREGLQILVDPGLGSSISFDNVAKVAAIASMCVQPEVSDRPFMGEVVQALKLVYNDTDVSNGIRSINGSLALRSPFWEGHGISRAQHTRDVTSFMSTEYDSSSIHGDDLEKRPLSASGLFSDSRWLLRQHSDSFRRHATSGPSRTNRENSPCYRACQINHGSMSDHALCRYFTGSIDRDFYRLWP